MFCTCPEFKLFVAVHIELYTTFINLLLMNDRMKLL